MPANPIDRLLPVTYSPELALQICELIASGETLVEITKRENMPSRSAVYKWLAVYPKFFDAYERAREVSAQSYEEKALELAAQLAGKNDFTGTKVQAINVAMGQYRWTAARRDKQRYGQQQVGATMVPIQINTTLNLGQDGQGPATDNTKSIYTVEASIQIPPAFTEGYDDDTVESISQMGEVLDLSAEGSENEASAFGVPDNQEQDLHRPKLGRPPGKGKHKSLAKTRATATRLARVMSKKEDSK